MTYSSYVLRGSGLRSWVTQLRKGLLEYCLLIALEGGEAYGYQIIQKLKGIEDLAITESTAYPILSRLREDGWVKMRIAPSSDGPPRRYYSLTTLGKIRLREMHAYWNQLGQSIQTLREMGQQQGVNRDERTGT